MIGSDLATNLFGAINPIGKTIQLGNIRFPRSRRSCSQKVRVPAASNEDDLAIVPLTVAQNQMLGITYLNMVIVQANPSYNITFVQVAHRIGARAGSRHHEFQ